MSYLPSKYLPESMPGFGGSGSNDRLPEKGPSQLFKGVVQVTDENHSV